MGCACSSDGKLLLALKVHQEIDLDEARVAHTAILSARGVARSSSGSLPGLFHIAQLAAVVLAVAGVLAVVADLTLGRGGGAGRRSWLVVSRDLGRTAHPVGGLTPFRGGVVAGVRRRARDFVPKMPGSRWWPRAPSCWTSATSPRSTTRGGAARGGGDLAELLAVLEVAVVADLVVAELVVVAELHEVAVASPSCWRCTTRGGRCAARGERLGVVSGSGW